jgi:hypothetical protein
MPKVKIPKRVAGVKVPKKVRKQAKKALKLTESRAVHDLALAGLTLAAEAMLDRGRAAAAGRTAPGAAKAGLGALDLAEVVHAAVAEGARRFLQGFEEGAAAVAAEAVPARKPRATVKRAPTKESSRRRPGPMNTAAGD